MEFCSKGLGKKTLTMSFSKADSLLSDDSQWCLKGVLEEPITWEYILLFEEADLGDFFALLQEKEFAAYIHRSPHRWRFYIGLAIGALQIAWRVVTEALRRNSSATIEAERVAITLPPASSQKKAGKRRKNPPYRRRLSTTVLEAPTVRPDEIRRPLALQGN
jgi:hypothetical protein